MQRALKFLEKPRGINIIFLLLLGFMLCALGVYAYLGTFTRYMADDYATASILVTKGFWGAQHYWWTHWSGRFSFTFIVSFVELFGLRFVPILPSLIIAIWLFGVTWASIPFLKSLNLKNPVVGSVFIACVVLWVTYRSVDDYPQIVFWQTGILTYPISPIAFLFGTGVAVRRAPTASRIKLIELTLWFLYAFFVGGFSETGVVIQISLIAVLLLILLALKVNKLGKAHLPVLLASFFGSIASLIVIFVAPGNIVRSGGYGKIPSLGDTLLGSLKETLLFIPNMVERYTLAYLFCFVAGFFLVNVFWSENKLLKSDAIAKMFVTSFLIVEAGVLAGILPAYVLRGAVPPERVLLFAYFLVACFVILSGGTLALLVRLKMSVQKSTVLQWISLLFLAVFMSVTVIPFLGSQLQIIPPLMEYSEKWDERHQILISASKSGERVVMVDSFGGMSSLRKLRTKLWISGDFEDSASHWVNRAAAVYYGVDEIVAK